MGRLKEGCTSKSLSCTIKSSGMTVTEVATDQLSCAFPGALSRKVLFFNWRKLRKGNWPRSATPGLC